MVGFAIDVTGLCNNPPGQLPAINTTLLEASPDELLEVLRVIAWFNLCQCVPGSPDPSPYPQPPLQVPTSWPTAPTFPCDPADLCASISDIRLQVHNLQASLAAALQLVTLQQRYRLPFAYISGATHSHLTGAGGFAVSRLLGVRVAVTAKPAGGLVLEGNPPYVWNLGWLSVVDVNGMWQEQRLTRDLQLWFPDGMPAATRFQWDLFPNVEISVTELEAEP